MGWQGWTDGWSISFQDSTDSRVFADSFDQYINADTWYHVVGVYDGYYLRIYKNSSLVRQAATGSFTLYHDGVHVYSGYQWNGLLDEVRISRTSRSADWIKFEYRNMNESDNELTWDAEEATYEIRPEFGPSTSSGLTYSIYANYYPQNANYTLVARSEYKAVFSEIDDEDDEQFGVVTSATETTLTDSTRSWDVNEWAGGAVMVFWGKDGNDVKWTKKLITANTSDTIYPAQGFDSWAGPISWVWNWSVTDPNETCRYVLVKKSKLLNLYGYVYGVTTYFFPDCGTVRQLKKYFSDTQLEYQDKIDTIKNALINSTSLSESDFVKIPAWFGETFHEPNEPGKVVNVIPGMVNLLNQYDNIIMPKPYGPKNDSGEDVFEKYIHDFVDSGITFIDDWPLHDGDGEVHCGTNAKRQIPAIDWWDL